jgi:hypothetical protein
MKTVHAENMGMDAFLSEYLNPALQEPRFLGHTGYLIVDPAGKQRSQIGEESVLDCIKRNGFQAQVAMTNAIEPRLRAVEKFLVEQRNGGPAILFDKEGCHDLIVGMQSRYRYKIKRDRSTEEKPEKNHPYSDLADALQYACLGTHSGLRGRMLTQLDRLYREPGNYVEPSAAGWT